MQSGNKRGSFLVRYSDNSPGKYALSIRDVEKVKHYRILRLVDGNFFLNSQAEFGTIRELIQYYRKKPEGLCVKLKAPCLITEKPQTAGLSREANEVWEIDRKSIRLVKNVVLVSLVRCGWEYGMEPLRLL